MPTVSGITVTGERVRRSFRSVRPATLVGGRSTTDLMAGFGGVAEYGITVRWDKNFLKLIRLLLERRAQFAMYGGVRFGGTLDIEDAFAQGFDHVAVAAGAGKADGAGAAERPREWRAYRVGFPDGAAAHRRGENGFSRQHAGAIAGGRRRWRSHGDRHGDRVARLLPGARSRNSWRVTKRSSTLSASAIAVEAAWTADERMLSPASFLLTPARIRSRSALRQQARPRTRAAHRGTRFCRRGVVRRSPTVAV